MSTITCQQCGWVLPATYKSRKCPMCKGLIGQGRCAACGKIVDKLYAEVYCHECYKKKHNERASRFRAKYHKNFDEAFAEWLQRISKVPKTYPTLTDQQWIKACNHFNGCAFCGSEEIDTRVYFVKFKDGGRYCDWNVLPACEKCAMSTKGSTNPFKSMAKLRLYETPALDKIVDYLEPLLLAAMSEEDSNE